MFIPGQKSGLKPELGFWQLFLLSISGTLGGGLFVLLGEGAAIASYLLPLSFIGAGIIAFLISRVYAELATSMPAPGGGQVYIRNAFGPHPLLFVIYWLTWLAEIGFSALNALGLGFYLSLAIPIDPLLISLIAIFLLVIINLRGIKKVGVIGTGIGLALLFSLIALAGFIAKDFSWSAIQWQKLYSIKMVGWLWALPLAFVAFVGNEDIAAIAAEIKNRGRNIPRVLSFNVITLTILTAGISLLFLGSFPLAKLAGNPHPFSLIAEYFNPVIGFLAIITAIFACASSLFFASLADTRTAFALSKAREFPKIFSKLNKHRVPAAAIIASGVLVGLLCLTRSATYVAYLAAIGFFLECVFVSLALIKLRKTRPYLPRPYLVRPFPLIPVLVILLSFILLAFIGTKAWLTAAIFSVVGIVVYFMSYFKKERTSLALYGIAIFLLVVLLVWLVLFILHPALL